MVQVNLLPDVKKDYLKSQRSKRSFIVGSVIVSAVALFILLSMFSYVNFAQPRHISNLQGDIDQGVKDLKSKKDAVKIVTVQGVLEQIPGLQDQKPLTSRFFTYLNAFTPKGVNYSEVTLNLEDSTLTLIGQSSTIEEANVLANNLKSAKFSYKSSEDDSEASIKPFSRVVFSSLGKSQDTDLSSTVSFELKLDFDSKIFDQSIIKPKLVTNSSSESLLLPSDSAFGSNQQGATQ